MHTQSVPELVPSNLPRVRELPSQTPRVETGPTRFGDDWCGLFVRGDCAAGYASILLSLASRVADPEADLLRSVAAVFASCDERGMLEPRSPAPAIHTLNFVRHEGVAHTTLGILRLGGAPGLTEQEVLSRLEAATTAWVAETEEGREAWSYSCEDFNVGDLCAHAWDDPSFHTILARHGLEPVDCAISDSSGAFSFDRVLVDELSLPQQSDEA